MESGRHIACLALIGALAWAHPAFCAEEVAEPPLVEPSPGISGQYQGPSLKELTDILARTRLKEAELHLLTIESKIMELRRRLSEMDRRLQPRGPSVSLVENGGERLAKIRFPDGSVYQAGKGAKLQNGASVIDIRPQAVTIEMDGRRLILPVMSDKEDN